MVGISTTATEGTSRFQMVQEKMRNDYGTKEI